MAYVSVSTQGKECSTIFNIKLFTDLKFISDSRLKSPNVKNSLVYPIPELVEKLKIDSKLKIGKLTDKSINVNLSILSFCRLKSRHQMLLCLTRSPPISPLLVRGSSQCSILLLARVLSHRQRSYGMSRLLLTSGPLNRQYAPSMPAAVSIG